MLKLASSFIVFFATLTVAPFLQAQHFVDVSKGGSQICAVTSDYDLICSTSSVSTRLEPPSSIGKVTQVEVGDAHACALDLDGKAICWGDNNFGQLDAPSDVVFESIDAGWNHTCAITEALDTICWGLEANQRTSAPTDELPFIETDISLINSCGLEIAGGVRCWGSNDTRFDPPGSSADLETFAITATNHEPVICALLASGRIECNREDVDFKGVYTDIEGLGYELCGLTTDGTLECQRTSPRDPIDLTEFNSGAKIEKIFGGLGICGIDENGEIRCTDAVRTPGSGFDPYSNRIALPNMAVEAPLAVDDLVASVYSDTAIELFWTAIRKGGDGRVVGADIYRDGVLLERVGQYNSYFSVDHEPGVNYTYEVRIVNSRGLVGPAGNVITVNTTDRSVSTGSTYVRPSRADVLGDVHARVYSTTSLELVWDRSPRGDVFGYEVYRNHEYLGFVNGISYFDDNIMPFTHYHYDVLAVNRDGEILGYSGVEAVGE